MIRSRARLYVPVPVTRDAQSRTAGKVRSDLKRLARSFVPTLADFCFIHLADHDQLRCAACAHATRNGQRVVSELSRIHRIVRSDPTSTVAQVVRFGRPQLRNEIGVDPDRRLSPRVAEAHRQLAPRSAIVVPLLSRDGVLGALTLGYAESGRRYTAKHLATVKRLAGRIVASLSHADPDSRSTTPLARTMIGPVRRLPPLRARV